MKNNAAGFTLIEILIVIFIISIVSTVALLSIGHNENRRMKSLATELTQMLTLAEEQAMLQPAVLGLLITPETFSFVTYQPSNDGGGMHWVPVDDKNLKPHRIPDNVTFTLSLGDPVMSEASRDDNQVNTSANTASVTATIPSSISLTDDNILPQIVISTNGDMTPFTLSIGKQGEPPLYVIKGDADGTLVSEEQP